MSASVLFDSPGPKTVVRHRLYSVLGAMGVFGLVALVVWQLYAKDQFAYSRWEPFFTPAYIQALLVDGVVQTVLMAVFSIIFAVVFGTIFGLGKLSDFAIMRWVSWAIVEFFRAVPVLLLMVLVFFAYGISRGDSGAFWSVVIALTLYNGSVLAEVLRAGMLAVPKGQGEAAYAVGMRKTQVDMLIVLPQAVKIMLPAIISQCVVALKDTSLGYAIAAPGLTAVGKQIYGGTFQNHVPTIFVLAACYIGLNLILTWLATLAEKRFVGEKEQLELSTVGAHE